TCGSTRRSTAPDAPSNCVLPPWARLNAPWRAHAWCVAHGDTAEQRTSVETPLAPPEQGRAFGRPEGWSPGYLDAMDWVGVRGSLAEPGLATVWARARVALVEGAEMSPWQRLLVTADSASGVASWLDPAE